ncbi:sensor histidine kinase [Kitasatospora sp. NBC_00315]|uniref:sensor histidine kinase n=1 Tax=Kitasatospora sp. NBC_00315 TaxID=2975963 RepID=UPI00324AEEA3
MATDRSPTPVARVLRLCLHLLVAGLLALAVARSFAGHAPHPAAVTVAAAVTAAVYAAGPLLGPVRRSRTGAALWLAALAAAWLVLLALTEDGVWLAFPLYFLQLHLLGRRSGLIAVGLTTAAAVTGFAWHRHEVSAAAAIGPTLGAAVATATVLGYQALYRESEERRRLIDELSAARADLVAAHHTAGVLAERERLAREIHDTLAQSLSSIQLLLRAAGRALPERTEAAAGYVEQARQAAQDNLAEARRFVRALTPPGLDGSSLPAALERLCAVTAEHSGVPVRFHLSGVPAPLPVPHETALLRIAQSALANTVRHAGASHAEVTLSYMDSEVALDVLDDGSGFDPADLPAPGTGDAGFGLPAMRARARALGGTFTLETAPGRGTALAVLLPEPAEDTP